MLEQDGVRAEMNQLKMITQVSIILLVQKCWYGRRSEVDHLAQCVISNWAHVARLISGALWFSTMKLISETNKESFLLEVWRL